MTKNGGLGLIELVVAMAIVGVLALIALPATMNVVHATRASNALESVYETLMASTRMAVVTSTEVVICPGGVAGCQGGIDWSEGWIAFPDVNGNRVRDASEPIIFERGPLSSGVGLTATAGRTRLTVQSNGSLAGSNVTLTLCDGRGEGRARALVVANSGRIQQRDAGSAANVVCEVARRR